MRRIAICCITILASLLAIGPAAAGHGNIFLVGSVKTSSTLTVEAYAASGAVGSGWVVVSNTNDHRIYQLDCVDATHQGGPRLWKMSGTDWNTGARAYFTLVVNRLPGPDDDWIASLSASSGPCGAPPSGAVGGVGKFIESST